VAIGLRIVVFGRALGIIGVVSVRALGIIGARSRGAFPNECKFVGARWHNFKLVHVCDDTSKEVSPEHPQRRAPSSTYNPQRSPNSLMIPSALNNYPQVPSVLRSTL
jgi:hypothetical protein